MGEDYVLRKEVLTRIVWEQVPKHLAKHEPKPGFKPLVDNYRPETSHILIGETGAGKSTACVHIVRNLLKKAAVEGGRDFWFARRIYWTRADKVTTAGGSDGDSEIIRRSETASLLILDDYSVPSKTLLGVLQERFDRQRPLIVTSGAVDMTQLADKLGGAAVVRWILQTGKQDGNQIWLPSGPAKRESRKPMNEGTSR